MNLAPSFSVPRFLWICARMENYSGLEESGECLDYNIHRTHLEHSGENISLLVIVLLSVKGSVKVEPVISGQDIILLK